MNTLENVVVGLDGCPGGWIACLWREPDDMRFCFVKEPGRLFEFGDSPLVIGIDIPIGLVEGPRDCDTLARQLLGKRRSSVFPAPDRRLLQIHEYKEANRLNRQWHGKGLSKQTFNLLPKISEVDTFACLRLSPVFEVHPELAFAQMAGAPMVHSKRKPEGFEERRNMCLEYNCPNGAAWALPNQTIGSMPLQLLGPPEGSMKEKLPKSPTRRCMISMVF